MYDPNGGYTDAADRRREEIARSAAVLFDKVGYHGVNMSDIARSVGLGKPTLYHYVKSKSEIVALIHDQVYELMISKLEGRLALQMPPDEILLGVITDTISVMDTRPGHLRVFFEHHRELPEEVQAEAARKRDGYMSRVESVIQDGVDRGLFDTDDVRLTALALHGMCNWSYQWYRPGGPKSAEETAKVLFQIFMRGLEVRGTSRRRPTAAEGKAAASPAKRGGPKRSS